jgi:hypothetical protein
LETKGKNLHVLTWHHKWVLQFLGKESVAAVQFYSVNALMSKFEIHKC